MSQQPNETLDQQPAIAKSHTDGASANGTEAEKKIPNNQEFLIPEIWCEVCKIECNSKETLESHKQGKKHKRILEILEATLALPCCISSKPMSNDLIFGSQKQESLFQEIWCEVCKIKCNGKEMLERHEQGKKHKKNLGKVEATLALAPISSEPMPSDPTFGSEKKEFLIPEIRCEVCKVGCNSMEMLVSHSQGKKHKKNLEKVEAALALARVAIGPVPNDSIIDSQKQEFLIPELWCEVCKIQCNSKKMLDSHNQGKRHMKNLVKVEAALALARVALEIVPDHPIINPKKQDFVSRHIRCEVCKLECNSKEMLGSHNQGKKHMKNLEKQKATLVLAPIASEAVPNNSVSCDSDDATSDFVIVDVELSEPHNSVPHSGLCDSDDATSDFASEVVQNNPIRCEICKIGCNSKEMLESHEKGKKHMKNLEKLKFTLPEENSKSRKVKSTKPENLEINNKTVDVKKTCEISNVVCNSDLVFENHLSGKKHLAMVTKHLVEEPEDLKLVFENSTDIRTENSQNKMSAWQKTEDLKTIKKKVVDTMRKCDVCDVACNSDLNFMYHLVGKKHSAMVKMGKAGPQVAAKMQTPERHE